MVYTTADYAIAIAALAAAILGLFNGFSGALAFLSGLALSLVAGRASWAWSGCRFDSAWARVLVTLVVALLAFGLVRAVVRRMVNGLLRQPADAVFGFIVAGATGFMLALAAVYFLNLSGLTTIESAFVSAAESLFQNGGQSVAGPG